MIQKIIILAGLVIPAAHAVGEHPDPRDQAALDAVYAQLASSTGQAYLAAARGAINASGIQWKETPVLFNDYPHVLWGWDPVNGGAMTANLVNSVLSGTVLICPDPFLPPTSLSGGVDYFLWRFRTGDAGNGIPALWTGFTAPEINDWWWYHAKEGEVHCGSNGRRTMPASWWTRLP